MSRGVNTRSVDKLVALGEGRRGEGADMRSKDMQAMQRSVLSQGRSRMKLLRSHQLRVLRVGLPSFFAGFLACVWLNVANKPPPVVVQKLVRKKKPKLTIEEIPDDDEPARDGEEETGGDGTSEREARPGEEMKMVLVVNDALGMSAGKIAAQCCHATLAVYQSLEGRHHNVLRQWEAEGQKKIALKCKTGAQLAVLAATAKKARLPHYLVADAGRTQVAAGSHTVLAIGPAPEMAINEVTGGLRLL
mmetsp:Transcript_12610/g.20404  ORF Transcript_12610/g.20404 Transcript_12610/m.20404 type:complete len:247 (+) Transcript_12610:231-971(+)